MGFMDILNRYVEPQSGKAGENAEDDFDGVAQTAPPEVVSHGLAEAFRTDKTPPFGQMVGQLFGQSDPQQRAGLLNQILGSAGPGLLGGLASGGLAGLLQKLGGAKTPVTADQTSAVNPEQVNEIVSRAEKDDPSIVDRVSDFYAQHPGLVKTLGSAALAIALAKMAQRSRG